MAQLGDCTQINRFGKKELDKRFYFDSNETKEKITKNLETDNLDWNTCLKEVNLGIDRLIATLRVPKTLDRERELKIWEKERKDILDTQIQEAETPQFSYRGNKEQRKFMGKFLASLILYWNSTFFSIQSAVDRLEEDYRLFQIALELAIFQKEKGQYPESLQELTPTCLKEIPLDIYSDLPHRYQKTGNGYLLYSVGPNRIDDQGAERYYDDPPGDDICVRVPLPPIPLRSK